MYAREGTKGTHKRLLDAAERLVIREGAAKLTLDAVAREAGMSKGGLLYHFPSKESLIAEMVEHLAGERFERELEGRIEGSDEGRWLRAYVETTFEPEDRDRNLAVQSGLFAAVANDPSLLEPLRERYNSLLERARNDGLNPELATVAWLASEGLWFLELFDIPVVKGETRERVQRTLINLIREGEFPLAESRHSEAYT